MAWDGAIPGFLHWPALEKGGKPRGHEPAGGQGSDDVQRAVEPQVRPCEDPVVEDQHRKLRKAQGGIVEKGRGEDDQRTLGEVLLGHVDGMFAQSKGDPPEDECVFGPDEDLSGHEVSLGEMPVSPVSLPVR